MANVDSFVKKLNYSVKNYTKTSCFGKNRVQSKPIRFACKYITACISVAKLDTFPHVSVTLKLSLSVSIKQLVIREKRIITLRITNLPKYTLSNQTPQKCFINLTSNE